MKRIAILAIFAVGVGAARGGEGWWRAWLLPQCPAYPDDYCAKTPPLVCKEGHGGADDYCGKSRPKVCAVRCKMCDDYCPKCLPRVLRCYPAGYPCGSCNR